MSKTIALASLAILATAMVLAKADAGRAQDTTTRAPDAVTPASAAPACPGPFIRAVDGSVRCIEFENRLRIRLTGHADRWRADSPRDWVRWPQALNDPADWLSESDAAVQQWLALASPRGGRMLTFALDVGSDGGVSGCSVDRVHGFDDAVPAAFPGLCEVLRRSVRIRGALGSDGHPVPSRYAVTIRFDEVRLPSETPREPLIAEQALSPAPPPPRDPPGWPPARASRLPTGGALARAEGGVIAFSRDMPGSAGVMLTSGPEGAMECQVIRSSGDDRFDQRACAAASRRGGLVFDWPTSGRVYPVRTPIHFVPVAGRPVAILPVSERVVGATISAAVRQAVRDQALAAASARAGSPPPDLAALQISAAFDDSGRVTLCEIVQSSGNDAADATACLALREAEGILPGRDIFGWSIATRLFGLTLGD